MNRRHCWQGLLGLSVGALFSVAQAGMWGASDLPKLPMPTHTSVAPMKLSLHDALLIALRNNPDIEKAELQRVLDKYDLLIAYNQFFPKYKMGATASWPDKGGPSYGLTPSVSLKTPIGTSFGLSYDKSFNGGFGATTLTVTQPLLNGFGYTVNMIGLNNSLDAVTIDRLNYKQSVISAVDGVVKAYRTLVTDYNNLTTKIKTRDQYNVQYKQDIQKTKAGQMSSSALNTERSSLETYKLGVVSAKNSVQQDYKAFLQTLGLDSTVKVTINKNIEVPKNYKAPPLQSTIQKALHSNVSYVEDVINMRKTERAVITAKQALMWTLNLVGTKVMGSNTTQNSGNSGPDVALNLTVPINNLSGKEGLLSAKISLINAKNALQTSKRALISNVTSQIETLQNDVESLKMSEVQVQLQEKTVKDTKLQLQYGKSTIFELTTQQNTLLTQQISLISTKIQLLNDIQGLHDTLGDTLKYWGIKLKY
jgi:outer membrane protein